LRYISIITVHPFTVG